MAKVLSVPLPCCWQWVQPLPISLLETQQTLPSAPLEACLRRALSHSCFVAGQNSWQGVRQACPTPTPPPISLYDLLPLNIKLCFPCLPWAVDLLFCFLIAIPHSLLICFSFAAQCLAVLLFASSPAGFHWSTFCCRPCQCNRTIGQKQAGKWGSWRQFCVCLTSMRLPGPGIYLPWPPLHLSSFLL